MGFDNTTENASEWMITKISSLLDISYVSYEEKEEIERMLFDTELKADEALAIIEYLGFNSEPLDPRKQFEKRSKIM
ncbi:MAG: hypothetical protein GOVbin4342_13 [Prokaryotic dsDNA virus sp.]|nr:MAG: hypothetical protein GOVbin4342_13 [Prokaryotic dsDNA virus sp.]|tara:strand:- start:11 stop:241 length:231 start_codon:yes stop_codon:yes gene_type:complete